MAKTKCGLENSTRPLVFTSASGCKASKNFDISSKNHLSPYIANPFCNAGLILIYFETLSDCQPLDADTL